MTTVATMIVVLADLLSQPTNPIDRCAREELGVDCSIRGVVQVRAVDPRRFLIAVDTEPSDGSVDHLFLFAGSAHDVVDTSPLSGSLVVRYDAERAEVRTADQEPLLIDLRGVTVAHYWGYGNSGGRLEYLDDLRQSPSCDGPVGVCWEAQGWYIYFPL